MLQARILLTIPQWIAMLTVAGCGAGWRQPDAVGPDSLPRRQQVQVWVGGHAMRLHAVVVGAATVSGIPYFRSVACDSCRIGFPSASVDSLRLGDPVQGFWKSIGLGAAVMVFLSCVSGFCGASAD